MRRLRLARGMGPPGWGLAALALAWLAGGCIAGRPSPFNPLTSPQQISGIYDNEPQPPGYRNVSLWQLVTPNFPPPREWTPDQPGDQVALEVNEHGRVRANLRRNGSVLASQEVRFALADEGDHLKRSGSGMIPRPHFPLLWMIGSERLRIGVSREEDTEGQLLIRSSPGATLWLLIMPIAGVGDGPGVNYYFEQSDSADPRG